MFAATASLTFTSRVSLVIFDYKTAWVSRNSNIFLPLIYIPFNEIKIPDYIQENGDR